MLIINGVGSSVVPYFLDGRHPGRWSEGAERLLGLSGPPKPVDLRRVLDGRDPVSGRFLPAHRPPRRRGGWDLVFSAPKSLSILHASASGDAAASVQGAHRGAVSDVMDHVGSALVGPRRSGTGRSGTDGLISAEFDHLANSAGETHLHTHVLVANLSRDGGTWRALDPSWYVHRRSLAALYQLGLRHHLHRSGWDLEWRLRPDGLSDLADVPTAAVRAASHQSRLVASAGRFEARRRADSGPGQPPPPLASFALGSAFAGHAAGHVAGPGPVSDHARPEGAGSTVDPDDAALARRVEVRLTGRRSDFRADDVVVALAASLPGGCRVDDALVWVDRFCQRMTRVPSPTSGARWTTGGARRLDDQVVEVLATHIQTRSGRSGGGAPGTPPPERVDQMADDLLAGPPVCVLGTPAGTSDLLAQAELLDVCRARCEAEGRTVAVDSPSFEGGRRWQLLSGIIAYDRSSRPNVLVVDQADRRTSSELIRLTRSGADQLVLVEGGTLPRLTNPASHGLVRMAETIGRRSLPPFRSWLVHTPMTWGRDGAHGRTAIEDLLGRWHESGRQALLIGLGIEEVGALNRAAVGQDRPERGIGRYRAGDRVVMLRSSAGLPPGGNLGTVLEPVASQRSSTLTVAWDSGHRSTITTGRELACLGFGYAVTPPLAGRSSRPLMVVGPASTLTRSRERVVAEIAPRPASAGRDHALRR